MSQTTNPTPVSTDDEILESIDPATGEVVGRVRRTPVEEVGRRIAAARAAQAAWGGLSPTRRAEILEAAAAGLAEAADEVGRLASREMGKPLAEGRGEARHGARSLGESVREIARDLEPIERRDARTISRLRFDPLGVAAVVTPWNFPVLMPQESVLPALVAGNAVLFKPSEETPLTGEAWAAPLIEALDSAGHPDVLQVVHGDEAQGRALVRGEVDLVVFTGSRAAGEDILQAAGSGLKRVILELGGKDPLIVLEDADLDAAVAFATRNCFRNAGQVCVSTERIYVHASIADRFTDRLVESAGRLRQGPGTEADVEVGPMVNARQKTSVVAQIEDAIRRGAKRLLGEAPAEGNFVPPTVLAGVDHSMPIMREETFGPVACVMSFGDDDEAVHLANDSPYGLGGAIFGGIERANAIADRLATAMVGINRGCGGAEGTPWVGARCSGYGYRGGPEGHRQFAQVRVISATAPRATDSGAAS
jgi:acyl-CoA reductase-like NAD-dependent aldehyde dehydrogenase